MLCPKTYPFVSKRPPVGDGYYESFNRDNVALVDVSSDPIEFITPTGISLASGATHDLDILVIATGFDAGTGIFDAIDIRGAGGTPLREAWAHGPRTSFGIGTPGFPNMLMISGPQATYGNSPVVSERVIEMLGSMIMQAREHGHRTIEVTTEAAEGWTRRLQECIDTTLLKNQDTSAGNWILGTNIPGKVGAPQTFLGGANNYFAALRECAAKGFSGFTFA